MNNKVWTPNLQIVRELYKNSCNNAYGPIKVYIEFSFSFILVSNLRFTSYFNFSFNLFLSNSWLLVFGFLQGSEVKLGFWTFFSCNYRSLAQQSRIRVFKLGFQNPGFPFPVSNPNWYFIFHVYKLQTRERLFSDLF